MRNVIARTFLRKYQAPDWAKIVQYQPPTKLQLAQLPTPIHQWNLPGVPSDFSISVKRDDLTGCLVTGTKIRKLEFILGRGVENDCQHVIAAGSTLSNCCRTVAAASRMLNMTPHFIMWDADQIKARHGNMKVNRILDCDIHHLSYVPDEHTELVPMMNQLNESLEEKSVLVSYGGYDSDGFHGMLYAFEEMMKQGVLTDYDDLVLATGSGATATGLAVSNYLTGSKLRIHAFISEDTSEYLREHFAETMDCLCLDLKLNDLLDVIEDCHGDGYGQSTNQELDLLLTVARQTGVILDPIYTIKAVKHLIIELNQNPSRFKGQRVLFFHTGGMFASLDGRLNNLLEDKRSHGDSQRQNKMERGLN